MKPEQALAILDQATQPGVSITRQQYCEVQQALVFFAGLIKGEGNTESKPEK